MRRYLNLVLCSLLVSSMPLAVGAAPIANPDPFVLFDDDESELFVHGGGGLALLLLDTLGASFGFIPVETGVPVELFGAADPAGAGVAVNFDLGLIDVVGSTDQRSFTPQAGPLVFYFSFDGLGDGGSPLVLFSLPAINAGGTDPIGTYRLRDDAATYSIIAHLPVGDSLEPFGMVLFSGVSGTVAPVPLPAPLALLAACGSVLLMRRRARSA